MTIGEGARRKALVAALGGLGSLVALAGAGSSAWACSAASATTSISPKIGMPGDEVTVRGVNYGAAPIEIRWNGAEGRVLATTQGPSFSTVVTVPAEAAGGMFYVAAVQRDGANAVAYKVADVFEVTGLRAVGAPAPGLSPMSPTADLWSAVAPGAGLSTRGTATAGSRAEPATSPNRTLGLISVGTAAVLGGVAVVFAFPRRRRVLARR